MSIKAKIAAGMLLTTILISTVGILAHQSLTDLVQTIRDESKPNMNLIILKSTLSGISNAESSVRAYTITKDTIYLYQYFNSVNSIEKNLNRLMERAQDTEQQRRIDSLAKLAEIKFSLLDQLIYLKKDDQVQKIFEKLLSNLTDVEEEKSKKKRFWNSLVKTKKPEMEEIQEVVSEVKEEELKKAEKKSNKEFDLTQEDNQVMLKIRKIVNEIEMEETLVTAQRAADASKMAKRTTNIITTFSVLVFLLLLLLGYLVLTWISRNREAKKKAEKLAESEAEFLANMSHEVRTPMNAIVGFSEQLGKTDLSDEQTKYISTIQNSAEHLLVIINDILDQAKLKSGKIMFEKVGFEMRKVVDTVFKSLALQTENKELVFNTSVDEDIPDILIGDPIRLTQILINLASNAIKFTEKGKVEILCRPVLKDNESLQLQLEVIDTGIGIDQEHLEKIFEDFYQADSGATRQHGGTGLGLTITKRLVEQQGGTITVSSKKGRGSRFTVTIPYEIGTTSDLELQQDSKQINKRALKGRSVLVADDEEYNRLLIKTILQKWDMKITLCKNGQEVLEALKSNHYDLILMDVRMPKMNGKKATRIIRGNFKPPVNQIPIIALTAAASDSDADKCIEAGMDGFLSKPFKEKQLYQKITEILGIDAQSNNIVIEAESKPAGKASLHQSYDLQELIGLSNGNNRFVVEMLETFVRNAKTDLKRMEEEFHKNQTQKVSMLAHKVVAPCRHLGLDNLVHKLKEIENTVETTDAKTIEQLIEQVKNEAHGLFEQLEEEIEKRQKTT